MLRVDEKDKASTDLAETQGTEVLQAKCAEAQAFVACAVGTWSPQCIRRNDVPKTLPRDRSELFKKATQACSVFLGSLDAPVSFTSAGELVSFPGGSFESGVIKGNKGVYVNLHLEKSGRSIEIDFYEGYDESKRDRPERRITYREAESKVGYDVQRPYFNRFETARHSEVEAKIKRLAEGEQETLVAEARLVETVTNVYRSAVEALRSEGIVGYIAPVGIFLDDGIESYTDLKRMQLDGDDLSDNKPLSQRAGLILRDGSGRFHLFGRDRTTDALEENSTLGQRHTISPRSAHSYPLGLDNSGNICEIGKEHTDAFQRPRSSATHLYIQQYYSPDYRFLIGRELEAEVVIPNFIKSLETTKTSDASYLGGGVGAVLGLEDYLDMRARVLNKLSDCF